MANDALCSVDGCERAVYRADLCRRHHYRLITHGDPCAGGKLRNTDHALTCQVPGCSEAYLARGLCDAHYQKRRIHGDPQYQQVFNKDQPCSVRGCGALQKSVGFCGKHYQRRRTHGDPLVSLRAEVGNGSISVKGYRIVFRPGHPNANRHGRLPEHRLVMSEMLARPLLAEENVHHINGNRLDNRPENLELWVRTQPCGQRVQDLVEWAQSILERYGPLVNAYLPGFDPNSSGD